MFTTGGNNIQEDKGLASDERPVYLNIVSYKHYRPYSVTTLGSIIYSMSLLHFVH